MCLKSCSYPILLKIIRVTLLTISLDSLLTERSQCSSFKESEERHHRACQLPSYQLRISLDSPVLHYIRPSRSCFHSQG